MTEEEKPQRGKVILCSYDKFDKFLNIRTNSIIEYRLEKEVTRAVEAKEIDPRDREAFVQFVVDTHNRMSPKRNHTTYAEVKRSLEAGD